MGGGGYGGGGVIYGIGLHKIVPRLISNGDRHIKRFAMYLFNNVNMLG